MIIRSWAPLIIALLVPAAYASDACKVLPGEKFGQIMGYAAAVNKIASTPMSCFYQGPGKSGGQFTIISENAGPNAIDKFKGPGSAPPAGSGLIGGTYQQGSVLFSVSIKSADQAKLQALVGEIKHNLK